VSDERAAAAELAQLEALLAATPAPSGPPVAPKRFKEERTPERLAVSWRWFKKRMWFELAWVVFFDSLAAIVLLIIGVPPEPGGILVPVLVVAFVVAVTYNVLAGLVNRTRIVATRDRLRVKHGPLPWIGNVSVPREDIAQLFTFERVKQRLIGPALGSANATKPGRYRVVGRTYELHLQRPWGDPVKLAVKLRDSHEASYLESTFEGFFGIADRPLAQLD